MSNPKSRMNALGAALAAFSFVLGACAGATVGSSGGPNSTGSAGAGGGASGAGSTGTGGVVIMPTNPVGPSAGGSSGGTTEIVPCTDGVDCECSTLSVAVIGKPGKWGAVKSGDPDTALQAWLNSSSAGTAKADNYPSPPRPITPDFLAPYNVIILASLSDDSDSGPFWTFDSSEVAAFQDWVVNKGGGVITLTGYSGDGSEIKAPNQLIAFSGISYNNDGLWAPWTEWHVIQCAGSNPLSDWNKTDPVIAKLSNNVTWVGLQNGRTINAPADAHVAATVPGPPIGNALVGKLVGKGRVLAYGDEWITYTSQWNGVGNPKTTDPTCAGFLPQEVYQTAQFWYNMIKWSQPSATCFKIVVDGPQQVVIW